MRTFSLLTLSLTSLALLGLAACETQDGGSSASSSSSSVASSLPQGRPAAREGEMCGGIAGFLCEPGLTCKYAGDYPDASGICVRE